jgi:redox-sensing transcriptional repressor
MVREFRRRGQEWVSSHDLAQALDLTSSTVRQDLSHMDLSGISKRGYASETLERVLGHELAADSVHRVIIVGAGNLGCALAVHGELTRQGFEIGGIFDADPAVVKTKVGRHTVRPMSGLEKVVTSKKIDLAIIAVPAGAAQEVADRLVSAGVQGLLNLTYSHLRVPSSVSTMDVRILEGLQELAYLMRAGAGKET